MAIVAETLYGERRDAFSKLKKRRDAVERDIIMDSAKIRSLFEEFPWLAGLVQEDQTYSVIISRVNQDLLSVCHYKYDCTWDDADYEFYSIVNTEGKELARLNQEQCATLDYVYSPSFRWYLPWTWFSYTTIPGKPDWDFTDPLFTAEESLGECIAKCDAPSAKYVVHVKKRDSAQLLDVIIYKSPKGRSLLEWIIDMREIEANIREAAAQLTEESWKE